MPSDHATDSVPPMQQPLPLELQQLEKAVAELETSFNDFKAEGSELRRLAQDLCSAVCTSYSNKRSIPLYAMPAVVMSTTVFNECSNAIISAYSARKMPKKEAANILDKSKIVAQAITTILQIEHGRCLLIETDGLEVKFPSPPGGKQEQRSELGVDISTLQVAYEGLKMLLLGVANATDGATIATGPEPLAIKAFCQTILQIFAHVEGSRNAADKAKTLQLRIVSFWTTITRLYTTHSDVLDSYVHQFLYLLLRTVIRLHLFKAIHPLKKFIAVAPANRIIDDEIAAIDNATQELQMAFGVAAMANLLKMQTSITELGNSTREHTTNMGNDIIATVEAGNGATTTEIHRATEIVLSSVDVVRKDVARINTRQVLQHSRVRFSKEYQHPPTIFLGRDNDVKRLVDIIISEPHARIAITGAGGIGKTALSLVIVHDDGVAQEFGERRYFISCEALKNVDQLIADLSLMFDISQPSNDALANLIAYLDESPPTMLVIDNLETIFDVDEVTATIRTDTERVLQRLAQVSTLTLLITMRGTRLPCEDSLCDPIQWSNAADSELKALLFADACEVFERIADNPTTFDQLDARDNLLRAVENVVLAVTLLARLVKFKKQKPTDLLERWNDEHTRMLRMRPSGKLDNMCVSIKISIDFIPSSEPETLQLLSVCSQLPDGLYPEVQKELKVRAFRNVQSLLETLKDLALVSVSETSVVKMLSPVRYYVAQQHAVQDQHRAELHRIYIAMAIMLPGVFPTGELIRDHAPRFLAERGNITTVLVDAIQKTSSQGHVDNRLFEAANKVVYFQLQANVKDGTISSALDDHVSKDNILQRGPVETLLGFDKIIRSPDYLLSNNRHHMARSAEEYFRVSEMIPDTPRTISWKHVMRAEYFFVHKQYEAAEREANLACASLRHTLALSSQPAESRHTRELEAALGILIDVASRRGDKEKALKHIDDCLALTRMAGDELGEARYLIEKGITLRRFECFDEANDETLLALEKALKFNDSLNVAKAAYILGTLARRRKECDLAISYLENARESFQSIGERAGIAMCSQELAFALRAVRRFSEAQEHMREAAKIYATLGLMEQASQCQERFLCAEPQFKLEEMYDRQRELGF